MSLIKILVYSLKNGKEPYLEWEKTLDKSTRVIIKNRLDRLILGNFGDSKIIQGGEGIWELRIKYGAGYRIYFGKQKQTIVILLQGGDKGSQKRDIAKAIQYWLDYKGSL